jgi:hypothetical protein
MPTLNITDTALNTQSKTQAIFEDDGEIGDPNAGKSKLFLALNPQPLARQTVADRMEREDAVEIGDVTKSDGLDGDDDEELGFGSDMSDSDSDDDDGDFNDKDLALDPKTAAKLKTNQAKRAKEEAQRATQLGKEHASASAEGAAKIADEMVVIDARAKQERRVSAKKDQATVDAAKARMATELVFDFNFFTAADGDGDGMLSLEEATAQGMTAAMFHMIDADGNGQLTKEEFQAWMAK